MTRPATMHARTVDAGRTAARAALTQAMAILDAWYDEARIAVCVICLGAFVRPEHGRQGARIYCSNPCRQLAQRTRRPSGRRPRAPAGGLPFEVEATG